MRRFDTFTNETLSTGPSRLAGLPREQRLRPLRARQARVAMTPSSTTRPYLIAGKLARVTRETYEAILEADEEAY